MKKIVYIIVGCIALVLGVIGIVLPLLPTTPFLLLVSFCCMRGSERMNSWFIETNLYKKSIKDLVEKKAMTKSQKAKILIVSESLLIISLILIPHIHVKILIVCVMIIKTYYILFKIKNN